MSLANCASHYENYPCSRKQNILIGFHGAWNGITVSRIMYVLNRLRHIKTLQFNKNLLLDSLAVECGGSRVQSPVKDHVIPKKLKKWYQ